MNGFKDDEPETIYGVENEYWEATESEMYGKCFTLKIPLNTKLWRLMIFLHKGFDMIAKITAPGEFITTFDYHQKVIKPDYDLTINMIHEVSKILEFDGGKCSDELARNHCVLDYLKKVISIT